VKLPGPDHPITIKPNANRVRVLFGGRAVGATTRALTLKEASYKPVLQRTDHTTHCPYKGDATYYSIRAGDRVAENAVWSYEQPYPAMSPIAGYLAFYANRVDAIEELPITEATHADAWART
jgi:uncharacterized protein (DUF427 family)